VLTSGVAQEERTNQMKAIIGFCVLIISAGAVVQATSISTTLSVTATGSLSGTGITATGTATMPNVYSGSAAFSGSLLLSNVNAAAGTVTGTVTITPTGGTLTGTLTLPLTLLEGLLSSATSSGAGSVAITGGTGTFANYTGSFPNVSGSGSGTATGGFSLMVTGAGTINTTGGTTQTPTPTITAVLDAASNTASVAEGSIFIVKGTNLSASGYFPLTLPYPTTSSGIQIAFTPVSGGTATNAYLVYLYNQSGVNQLAAILPSTLAAGNYNVTVTNNGSVSAPASVTVVQHKPELFTQDQTGAGLAVVQNYVSPSELDIDRFTTGAVGGFTISPAYPGQTMIAWATGLGPITTGDNAAPPFLNFLPGLNVQVIVGGVSITPTFAGRSGYPGEDQINLTLPPNIPTGCTESFQISVNGVLSNGTFISIAPSATAGACVAPGLTTSQLQNLDNGGTLTAGGFALEQFSGNITVSGQTVSETSASVSGGFTKITGFELASSPVVTTQPGVCQVIQLQLSTSTSPTTVSTSTGATYLDAGAITLNGPSGSNITNAPLTETSNLYTLAIAEQITGLPSGVTLPGIPNASIVPGTYTLKGAGGKDVGPFTTSLNLGSLLTITGGLPTTVNRSAGLTLNWTGGGSTDTVEIFGTSGTSTSTAEFICITTAGVGTFTVPASVLNQLPAAGTSSGLLGVFSSPAPSGSSLFSAPLTAGGAISNATFLALLGVEGSATYQ
jgi:uncharacterized protein (TIGR03437 family)